MDVVVDPRPLAGQIPAVASKSDAHRLLICAALADGPTELGLQSLSQDILATMDCLKALGADIRQTAPNTSACRLPCIGLRRKRLHPALSPPFGRRFGGGNCLPRPRPPASAPLNPADGAA